MKNNLPSSVLLFVALGVIGNLIANNPPGGVPWAYIAGEPASWMQKSFFLAATYLWPALLSCAAIFAFQMQFRLGASGANKRTVFSVCVLASGMMLTAIRTISQAPASAPAYMVGMALGYTMMSRLYAVRLRTFFGRVRMPWPIWRGDTCAVKEIDQAVRTRVRQAS